MRAVISMAGITSKVYKELLASCLSEQATGHISTNIRLWRPCVMCLRGPNNVERAMQIDPTLLCCTCFGTKKEIFRTKEMLGVAGSNSFTSFKPQQHATTCNRVCKWTQHVTSHNAGSCQPTLLCPFVQCLLKRSIVYRKQAQLA